MAKPKRFDNPDFVPLALHQLGGASQFFDVEEIFQRCYELAPERFGWRKLPYPNYKTLSKALRDLEGKNPDLLLKTPDGLQRQLSAKGVDWVRERGVDFESLQRTPGANPPTRRTGQRLLNELRDHPSVQAFADGDEPELIKFETADALACSPDSPPSLWRERIETFRAAAADAKRADLLEFLDYLENQKPEWFGEK